MRFLFPAFLFALFTIAIPIIIHLFNFRRHKTVYFSHVNFLKDIKKQSRKKSRLKQLLILLARIFTIVFLVFAFSQPYIPEQNEIKKQPNQLVAVYIDNSFSMNAISENGQLLELARNKALEISLAYPPGTRFRLFTNDLNPKHRHILNKDQFIQQVAEIKPSPKLVPLSLIYNRFVNQHSEENPGTDKNIYLISDFQRRIADPENFTQSNVFSYFIPLEPNEVVNIYIDSCWVEVPAHRLNQEETLFVRIKNNSSQDFQNLPLKLYLNDSLKSITNFSVNAENEIISQIKYTNNSSGSQLGKVEITDYPFTTDNSWYISYFVEPNLKTLIIYDGQNNPDEYLVPLVALFDNDDYIQLDQMDINSLQISRLSNYHTIILLNSASFSSGLLSQLKKLVQEGTSVVLFPANNTNFASVNSLLASFSSSLINGFDTTSQEISGIDFDNDFYKNVFKKKEENAVFPKINVHLTFEKRNRSSETNLLWVKNGDKAFSMLPYEKGKLWLFSFPLDENSEAFTRDILFVPTMYNIVLNSIKQQEISFTIGNNLFYTLSKNENGNLNSRIEIKNVSTGETYIPGKNITERGTRLSLTNITNAAGHYLVLENGETISAVALNYNRDESDLRYVSKTELGNRIDELQLERSMVISDSGKNFSETFEEIQKGKQLWKLCIILALLFILAEVLIIRFWKQ